MASVNERPEALAFQELEQLVAHLADELASFRKRALQAEARLKRIEGTSEPVDADARARVRELERENEQLRARLNASRTRVRQTLERVRFLRQQQEQGAER